jgi:hypothetical protein
MNWIMEQFMWVNGRKRGFVMAEVCKFGVMALNMKGTGRMIWPMERVDSFTLMEMFMRVNGIMIRHTGGASISIWMVPNIQENGKKINNTVMDKRHGLMAQNTKEIMNMERSMEPVHSDGLITHNTLVNSTITTSKERECTLGVMDVNMRESGKITKCMARAPLLGLTEGNM